MAVLRPSLTFAVQTQWNATAPTYHRPRRFPLRPGPRRRSHLLRRSPGLAIPAKHIRSDRLPVSTSDWAQAPARCTAVKSVSAERRLRHLRRQTAAEVSRLHRLCHLCRPDFVRQPKRQRLFHRRASHRPSVGESRQTGYLIPSIRLFTSGCFFLKSSSIFLSKFSVVLPLMIPRLNAQ